MRQKNKKEEEDGIKKERKMLVFDCVEQLLFMISSIKRGKNFWNHTSVVQILAAQEQVAWPLELQFLISKTGIITFILNKVVYTIYFCIVPGTLWVLLISSG